MELEKITPVNPVRNIILFNNIVRERHYFFFLPARIVMKFAIFILYPNKQLFLSNVRIFFSQKNPIFGSQNRAEYSHNIDNETFSNEKFS